MKRFMSVLAIVVLVGLVVAAVAYGLSSDGPVAYSVRGTEVSQQAVDAELTELADNGALNAAIKKQRRTPLAATAGSITTQTSAGWVGLRVALTAAAQEVDRRGLTPTTDDRARGRKLAAESVGGDAIFATLSGSFQQDLEARWTDVAVLEQAVLANPTPALRKQVAQLCPSGRYVSHILVDTEQQASAIKQAIDRGGDFAKIAASSSKDASAKDGGRLGCLDGQKFVEPFASVAATQPIGVVSNPFQTQFGYHVILVTGQPAAADVQRVALEAVLGRVRGANVTVDARYGAWDRRNGQVVPPVAPGAVPTTVPSVAPSRGA